VLFRSPFLFNLFNDSAIIGLPRLFRRPLASFISRKRAVKAQAIYDELGGRSPILENTEAQAQALQNALAGHGDTKVFICMRYWHPMAEEVVKQVKAYAPDHVILMPLYPQFSSSTTGSSFTDWHRAAKEGGLSVSTTAVCCYPTQKDFVTAHAQLVQTYVNEASRFGNPRVLFSAHGLPEKNIRKGDPYQWQVEQTMKAIVDQSSLNDAVVCYQSRVGPLKWIGPSTEDELNRAVKDKVPVVLVPIAFVSEHSETLVELDIEYAELVHSQGLNHYYRVPTLSVQAHFIAALADMCLKVKQTQVPVSHTGGRVCPKPLKQCPCRA
jgi:ferrochelatase